LFCFLKQGLEHILRAGAQIDAQENP